MIGMDEIWMQKRLTTASSTATAIPGELRISDQTVRNRLRELLFWRIGGHKHPYYGHSSVGEQWWVTIAARRRNKRLAENWIQ